MRIGIVTTWMERGAAYVSKNFLDVLSKTDDVFIYARGGEEYPIGDPKWDKENVYWGKRSGFIYFYASYIDKSDFINWIKNTKIDVVFFNEQHYFEPVVWCKQLGLKTVAYIDYYTELTIPLFDIYDCVVCNTQRHYFAFRNHKNPHYIKWGTDVELFSPRNEKHEKVTFFHSSGMGGFRKGTDLLLQAFYNVPERNRAKLLIHSQVSLEESFPQLKGTIKEMIDDGTLEVVEETVSAPGLYHKGDVYVYPSRLDGLGLTLMEAISCGLACITVDNAPMNEFINPEFGDLCPIEYFYSRADGYYWPIGVASTDCLTEILYKYISKERDVEKMKLAAREYAVNTLNFEKNCAGLHKIIEETENYPIDSKLVSKIKSKDKVMFYRLMYVAYKLNKLKERLLKRS